MALLSHAVAEIRGAAARALATAGTIRAVAPLLPLTEGLLHGDVKEAAREAIRSIQARLGDAEAGRVSIAPVESSAGAVSLAGAGGEVSLTDARSSNAGAQPAGPLKTDRIALRSGPRERERAGPREEPAPFWKSNLRI